MWLGGGRGGGVHVIGGEKVMDEKGEEEGEMGCLKSEV